MKVSLNWVKQWVDIDLGIDELVNKIGAQLGAVEEVIDIGKKYQGIIVAKVVTCEKHPNADKLSLCTIDDGGKVIDIDRDDNGLVQVVCGAPNVKAGMLVAWLPPGSTVPASYDKEPFVLGSRELRGTLSHGMLASPSELDFSDDHSGILELIGGKPGQDFAEECGLKNDYIIDIENKMFTHRPDCFGMLGVAREIAGITHTQFKTPGRFMKVDDKPRIETDLQVTVINSIPELVPRFMAQTLDDVTVRASSQRIQASLAKVGIRPINNIVDVTNYMMIDSAQPLHAYDYDKLCKKAGTDVAQLETRLSKKGETLKLLNGKTVTFEDEETVLITTNDIPVGIGGVMGGADTEVDEHTKRIVMECANFDMYSIRRTSMKYGIFTDAVTRFNKGQSPLQNPMVLQLATELACTVAGKEAKIGKVVDKHTTLRKPIAVHVADDFINSRLGLDLSIKNMAQLLENVEFDVAINGPTLAVTPPFWRTDIEIAEDVVEEIGRLHGFDNLPLQLPRRSIKPVASNQMIALKNKIRTVLSAAGANELYLYSFVHGDLLETSGQDMKKAYRLSNALSPQLQYYRLSLTPSLLDKVHGNIKAGHEELAVYELGKSHNKEHKDPVEKTLPEESQKLAFVIAADDKLKMDKAGYFHARRYLDYLADQLHMQFNYAPLEKMKDKQAASTFDTSRSAEVSIAGSGEVIGVIGEYTTQVKRKLKLPSYCAGFELSLESLLVVPKTNSYHKIAKFPSVSQDICLRSKNDVPYASLQAVVEQALSDAPQDIEINPLDIYQPAGKDYRQTTFRITVTSHDRTLTDTYVSGLLDEVAKHASSSLKATRV